MTKKCNKFESLFIFSDEESLKIHMEECEDCKKEFERMNRVSELVQEVKPHYTKSKHVAVRVACMLFALVIGGMSLHIADRNYGIIDTVVYGTQFTAEDLGLQTDDYGLVMVDE